MNYYLLLGGNMGDVDTSMSLALSRIAEAGRILAVSSVVESPPWGFSAPEPFHNAVVRLSSDVGPFALLSFIKHLEVELGRKLKRAEGEYESRPIDIDILFCDSQVVNTEVLQIPHPRLHLRRFTLVPLAEVAPGLVHPVSGKTVAEMLADCDDESDVRVVGRLIVSQ